MSTKICPTCKAPIPANAPGGFCPACLLRDAEEPVPAGRAAPPLAEIAAAFPHLEIESLIGQGGMGFVYKARQPALDRTVAVKILAPALGRDPAFAERFAREARVLGKLNHPNIVTVFEHGVTPPSTLPSTSSGPAGNPQPFFYLLMEFVDGVNLRQAMRAGRFTPSQALAVVPGICDALQAAHAQGVWHRDIKPENILLDARGGVKIADFGIARIVGDPGRDFTLTSTGAALGSAAYMAPEQHERPHDVDHRADIYSLGVVIYEMLTGELPLGRFPAPSERAAVSARIDEIVLQTLEKERELRQQSAAEVKADVTRAARTAGERTPARSDGEPATITQWSMGLALGGIVMFIASAMLTRGATQEALHTFAMLALVLGFVGSCVALSKMAHGRISNGWRGGLRGLIWSPPVHLGLFTLSLIIFMISARRIAHDEAARPAHEAAPPEARLKAQAAAGAIPPGNSPGNAKANPAQPAVPAIPAVPVEEVFRKMNAAANESNGAEFVKHMNGNPSSSSSFVLPQMQVFLGEIAALGSAGGARPSDARVFAELRRRDGVTTFTEFNFMRHREGWLFMSYRPAPFRAACRIEFRPERGSADAILRTHLRGEEAFRPVKGSEDVYEVLGFSTASGDAAATAANGLADRLKEFLGKMGLGESLKIIAPAEAPAARWMGDEPIALEKKIRDHR